MQKRKFDRKIRGKIVSELGNTPFFGDYKQICVLFTNLETLLFINNEYQEDYSKNSKLTQIRIELDKVEYKYLSSKNFKTNWDDLGGYYIKYHDPQIIINFDEPLNDLEISNKEYQRCYDIVYLFKSFCDNFIG